MKFGDRRGCLPFIISKSSDWRLEIWFANSPWELKQISFKRYLSSLVGWHELSTLVHVYFNIHLQRPKMNWSCGNPDKCFGLVRIFLFFLIMSHSHHLLLNPLYSSSESFFEPNWYDIIILSHLHESLWFQLHIFVILPEQSENLVL